MVKRYVFGCLFGLVLIFGIGVLAGSLGGMVDIPSLIIVLGLPFAAVFISHGPARTGKAIQTAFEKEEIPTTISELRKAKACIKALNGYLIVSTLMASIIGGIGILTNLKELSHLGPNFAVLRVSNLYVTIFILLFTSPLIARLEDRIIGTSAQ